MITRSYKEYEALEEAELLCQKGNFASADACSPNADEVIHSFDEQLAAFGLEVVQYDTGGDHYFWTIVERKPLPLPSVKEFVEAAREAEHDSLQLCAEETGEQKEFWKKWTDEKNKQ